MQSKPAGYRFDHRTSRQCCVQVTTSVLLLQMSNTGSCTTVIHSLSVNDTRRVAGQDVLGSGHTLSSGGDPCKSCKSEEKILPTPTPTTHPHLKQDRKFSVYLNGGKEVDRAISEFSPTGYLIIPISESCVIGNLAVTESGDYSAIADVMTYS